MSRIVDKSGLKERRVAKEGRESASNAAGFVEDQGKARSTHLEKIQTILIQPWYDLSEVLRVPLREGSLVIRK